LIRNIGLSSHDSVEGITGLIDTGEFDVMLVQYNYLTGIMSLSLSVPT